VQNCQATDPTGADETMIALRYILHPAGPGLVDPLRKLIETEFGATRVAPTYGDPNDPDSTSYDSTYLSHR
jgi:hypothetical protein